MSDLVTQGKVLYWGTSVWESEQIERAVGEARRLGAYLPAVEQPRYNMLDRHVEPAIMPTCAKHGIGMVVWSPLAQGILTGKYNDGTPEGTRGADTDWLDHQLNEKNLEKVRKLSPIAAEFEITVSQLALAWVLRRPEISSAIIGATKMEQLAENLAATAIELTPDTVGKIETIIGEAPVTKFKF
jgi:aryl-alcohol dehydrogenase-like predicted oxidoreductase